MTLLPATTETADLSVYAEFDGVDDGLDAIAPLMRPPRITSNMKSGRGFADELTGEMYGVKKVKNEWVSDVLPVTVLATTRNRAFWEVSIDEGGGGNRPDCRSNDGVEPTPDSLYAGTHCAECPMAQWVDNPDREGKVMQRCEESLNLLVYNHDTGRISTLRLKRKSAQNFANYATAFRATKKSKMPPIFTWVTEIRLAVIPDDFDDHLEATFSLGDPVPVEEVRELLAIKEALGWRQAMAEDLADGPDGGVDPDAEAARQQPSDEPFAP